MLPQLRVLLPRLRVLLVRVLPLLLLPWLLLPLPVAVLPALLLPAGVWRLLLVLLIGVRPQHRLASGHLFQPQLHSPRILWAG